MGPPKTIGVCIRRHDTDVGRPGDPQQPTSGAQTGEPTGTAHPPPRQNMDADAHSGAAADPGPHTQASPAASPGMADTAEEAPCPQATRQPEARTCAVRAPRGTGHTDAGGQGTTWTINGPPAVLHEDRAEGATDGAQPPQSPAAGECVHPGAAMHHAQVGTHDNPPPGAPETEDHLASIFNAAAPTADQGPQTDKHLYNSESFAAFEASCREGAPTTGQTTTSALRRVSSDREPTSPAQDPASAFLQAHLRRNYAAFGLAAETHTTTVGDGQAGGQPQGLASQRPCPQGAPAQGVRAVRKSAFPML